MEHFGAIIFSSAVGYLLGFFWYSPKMFGKRWNELQGVHIRNRDDLQKHMMSFRNAYIASLIGSVVTAWFLWIALGLLNVYLLSGALLTALILWAGVVAPYTLTASLFAKRDIRVWAIDTGYQLAQLLLVAGILNQLG